jgi:hypothetical protein
VHRCLRDAGIDCLSLKGPITADLLDLRGDRAYSDCDVLVAPGSLSAAVAALAARGFVNVSGVLRQEERDSHSQVLRRSPVTAQNTVELDLHTSFHGVTVPDDAFWQVAWMHRAKAVVAHVPVVGVDRPLALLLVVLHAARSPVGAASQDLRRAVAVVGKDVWESSARLAAAVGALNAYVAACSRVAGIPLDLQAVPTAISYEWRLKAAGAPDMATETTALSRGTAIDPHRNRPKGLHRRRPRGVPTTRIEGLAVRGRWPHGSGIPSLCTPRGRSSARCRATQQPRLARTRCMFEHPPCMRRLPRLYQASSADIPGSRPRPWRRRTSACVRRDCESGSRPSSPRHGHWGGLLREARTSRRSRWCSSALVRPTVSRPLLQRRVTEL